ncbi:MAG: energy transducer TonB [Acidobacteriia bacterium]|nr:energy transducer TonB [Terriglobia bacterium]
MRNYRAVGVSVAGHLVLLLWIVFHHPKVIELTPVWLAYGDGTRSYRVTYFPPNGEDAALEVKLVLPRESRAPRARPRSSAPKPAADHQPVPADAEAADHNSRAGSPLGTMIDGPITGHEVHVAYPVVYPDPPVARSDLPRDLQGDVVIEVTIDSQGNVVETKIVQAIGHGIDEKIEATLRRWHYQPATLDGVPVASKHDVHFHFPA